MFRAGSHFRALTRLGVRIAIMLCVLGAMARGAGAQRFHALVGDTLPPPTMSWNTSTTDTLPSFTLVIQFCGETMSADTIWFNGTNVTSSFTLTSGGSDCLHEYKATGTVNPVAGNNTIQVDACSASGGGNFGSCGGALSSFTRILMAVTPKNTAINVSPNQDTSFTFLVHNYTSGALSYIIAATCSAGSAVTGCSAPTPKMVSPGTPQSVVLSFNTGSSSGSGSIQLKATNGSTTDSAKTNVTVAYKPLLTVNTEYTNALDQDQGRCYLACFAMSTSISTVPYISRDQSRAVTLVYNGERVASRPIINADVLVASGSGDTTYTLSYLSLAAMIHSSGAWQKVVFLNGDTTIYFAGTSVQGSFVPHRLSGQFNAGAYPNSNYPVKIIVTAYYTDNHTEVFTDSSYHFIIYNRSTTPVANGWTILGQDKELNEEGASNTIAIGRASGSTIRYDSASQACFGWGCSWAPPPGASASTQMRFVNADSTFGGGFEISYPDSSKEYYSASTEWILRRISRQNDTVFYGYDGSNRLTSISDPYRTDPSGSPYDGHTYWHLKYGTNGLDSIVEPDSLGRPDSGRVTRVTVNSSGYLTTWTDPGGGTTKFGYDTKGRLDSITDRNGNLTRYVYDTLTWKLDSIISPSIQIDSNSTGSPVTAPLRTFYAPPQTLVVPRARTSPLILAFAPTIRTDSLWGYVVNTGGQTTHIQTDRWGQLLQSEDARGYVDVAYARDTNGFPRSVTNSSGQTNTWTYSGSFMTSSTPSGQSTTNYVYGSWAQLDSSYGGGQPTQRYFVSDSTYKRGHVDSIYFAGGVSRGGATTCFYAATSGKNIGHDLKMTDSDTNTTIYGYDTAATGNRNSVTDSASGRRTSTTFDGKGRVATVKVTGAGGTTVNTTRYDNMNRADTTYDAYNRATMYGYDSVGNVTSTKDPAGNTYTTVYNAVGWATSQTDPGGRTTSMLYNGFGTPTVVTNRRNQQVTYRYDKLDRLVSVTRPAAFTGDSMTYDSTWYSALGDSAMTINKLSKDVTYYSKSHGWADSANTWIHGTKIWRYYHHDAFGRVDSVSVKDSVSGGFDPYTRHYYFDTTFAYLDSLKLRNQKIAYSYTNYQVTTTTFPTTAGNVSRSDTYTGLGTIATSTWSNFGGVGASLSRQYNYDSTGRIVQMNVDGIAKGDTAFTYSYDLVGELVQRQIDTVDATQTCTIQQLKSGYCYIPPATLTVLQQDSTLWDSNGNLDSIKVGSADTVGHVLAGNRLNTWTGLTFYGDSDGNRDSVQSSGSTTHYIWSSDGQLRRVKQGTSTRTYYYNAMGQLVYRSDSAGNSQFYIWDNGQLLAILDSTARNRVAEFVFAGTDQPIARITGNSTNSSDTVNFLVQDAIGNVFAQWNGGTAEVEQQIAYDPWGAATVSTVTHDTTQLRWKGLLYEGGVTGLYYMRARWYDPVTRRFVSPDPMGLSAGINQFAFARGDPINGADPTGLCEAPTDDDPGDCGDTGPDASYTCYTDGSTNSVAECISSVEEFLEAYNAGYVADSTSLMTGSDIANASDLAPATTTCVGTARVLGGNPRTIGRTGGFGIPVQAGSAAVIPSQWGGKAALRPYLNQISGSWFLGGFSGITDVVGNATVRNVRDKLMDLNPNTLIIEVPSGIDQGVTGVTLSIPSALSCPDGTQPTT